MMRQVTTSVCNPEKGILLWEIAVDDGGARRQNSTAVFR